MPSNEPRRPTHAASAEEIAAQRAGRQTGAFAVPPQQPHAQQQPVPTGVEQPIPAVMSQTTGVHWPQYVNQHRLVGALVAGFAAVHIADMFGYWMSMFGLPKLDFAFFNGLVLLTEHNPTPQWLVGYLFHTMNGMVFALGYALVIFPLMGKTLTTTRNLARSLAMGLVLATLSLSWWMPGNLPDVGIEPGAFSMNFGWETIVAVYFWHVAWSVGLGLFFNPQD